MKIKIDITTCWNTYSIFVWDKETQSRATDELRQLVTRFLEEPDAREEIAYELMNGWEQEGPMLPHPYFSNIEVEYPDGEHPDEDIRPTDEVENNEKDIHAYYEEELESHHPLVILQDNQMKRGHWEAEVESRKPFNINYLSVIDGVITYGSETLEFSGDGEGNYSERFWQIN